MLFEVVKEQSARLESVEDGSLLQCEYSGGVQRVGGPGSEDVRFVGGQMRDCVAI